jgi:nitroreductase
MSAAFLESALPEGAKAFLGAMRARYACKRFDGSPLGPELEGYLLECGRLSPSSFGLEHWRFIAARDRALVGRLFEACFSQEAVGTASLVVSILVRRSPDYEPGSDFVRSRAARFPGGWPAFFEDYKGYYAYLVESGLLEHWSRAQAYIACANMMTGAAAAGLDSCAIEGFDEAALLAALEEDPARWRAGLVVALGRRGEEAREKIREPVEEIAEYR